MTREFIEERIERARAALTEYEDGGNTALAELVRQQLKAWQRLLWELPRQRDPED